MNYPTQLPPVISSLVYNQNYQFWFLQITYWLGLSVISFVSLTLWYARADWIQITHILSQSLIGMALSVILHWIFTVIWDKSLRIRASISLIAIFVIATVWTVIRIYILAVLSHSDNLWSDFGGWYFSSVFVFLCWSALHYGFTYYRLLNLEHEKFATAEKLAREAQIKMLRYQINPHLLFNTLNSINALVRLDEPKRAQKMIHKLSSFLRISLDSDPVKLIPLKQEIEILALYLDIEKIRFTDRLTTQFDIDPATENALVPSFILQPLIENSIKHAISPSKEMGLISITAWTANNRLFIETSDTGPGIKEDILASEKCGVGLSNTLQRLRTLYGNAYTFSTSSARPHGLKTQISIPLQKQ